MASNHLESLRRGNAAKPFQSQLVPHLQFIEELRARRVPYSQISAELISRVGLKVAASTIHAFVKARSRRRDVFNIAPATARPAPATGSTSKTDSKDPIERLKALHREQPTRTERAWSFYDPTKPLEKISHHQNEEPKK
jgi:hypothetical protein